MNHSSGHSPAVAASGWDRAAILTLGLAGFALSYDALQQMAVAIHVRGLLSYVFPLLVDGFIAYGVRAALVLRDAPTPARLYTWALIGTATTASIWANALHAVRLNSLASGGGLRLGDLTVGALSTLAPLALAGAVHLLILITRHHHTQTAVPGTVPGTCLADRSAHTAPADQTLRTGPQHPAADHGPVRTPRTTGPDRSAPHPDSPTPDQDGSPDGPSGEPADQPADRSTPAHSDGDGDGEHDVEVLLPIARLAIAQEGRINRTTVRRALRDHNIQVSNQRIGLLLQHLRTEG